MAVKKINIPFATPIPILIKNTFTTVKYPLPEDTMPRKMCGFPLLAMTR